MEGTDILMLFFAGLGGGLPPLIWLFFWLREDAHPEPKPLIIATFIGGMIAVPLAHYLETLFTKQVNFTLPISELTVKILIVFFVIAGIEELVKYLGARVVGMSSRNYDEPIDAIIYLITAALGFAALENVLFLINNLAEIPLFNHGGLFLDVATTRAIVSNNLRFIGANVLHVVSSGLLGVFIGLAFYKSLSKKIVYTVIGFFTATILHFAFNYFIITFEDSPIIIFSAVWILAILLILLFERVKRVRKISFGIITPQK